MKTQSILIGFLAALLFPALALAAQTTVSLSANSVNPSIVTINPGDTVVWNNIGSTNQSVMANNGAFQSGAIGAGGQFAATFNTSGTYNYYDNASGSAIVGEVIVSGTNQVQPTYVTTPASTSGSTASLTSEIQSLIAEIDALEGQSGGSPIASAPTYATGSCPQIGRVLSYGTSGSDVTGVQQFLGVSPATGFYGSLTQTAVENWQAANNIISYGTPATTGYGVVGPRTEAAIRLACSGGSGATTSSGSGSNSDSVSGFIQVSPISGAAPLTITVVATVNTANACGGGIYTLGYGDGTVTQPINVAQGNCSQQNQTFQHTYQYGGTYSVTLSAGTHQSSATVTVSGAGAPSTTTNPSTPSQPTGSISALVTSGPAPLNATFYVSCVSGLAYDVVFGDGTDLGGTGVSQSSCNGGLQGISHTYTTAGSYTAQLEIFVQNANGTVTPQNVATQSITVGSDSTGTTSTTTTGTTGSSRLQPPALTPNVGGNPLAVSLQFLGLSCGQPYSITWGDEVGGGFTPGPNIDCVSGTPSGQTQTFSESHTYAQAGSYTITLNRTTPSGSSQTDPVGVSISN